MLRSAAFAFPPQSRSQVSFGNLVVLALLTCTACSRSEQAELLTTSRLPLGAMGPEFYAVRLPH